MNRFYDKPSIKKKQRGLCATDESWALWKSAAKLMGVSTNAFVVAACDKAAETILLDRKKELDEYT